MTQQNVWAPETNPAGATPWSDEQVRNTPIFQSLKGLPGAAVLDENEIVGEARRLCVLLFEKRSAFMLQADIESIAKKLKDAGIDVSEKGLIIYTTGADAGKFKVRGLTATKPTDGSSGGKKFKREYYRALVGQEFSLEKKDERTSEEKRGTYRLKILANEADPGFRVEVHSPNNTVVSFPPRDANKILPGEVLKLNDVMPATQLGAQGTPAMHFDLWAAYEKVAKSAPAAKEKEQKTTQAQAQPAGAAKATAIRSMLDE